MSIRTTVVWSLATLASGALTQSSDLERRFSNRLEQVRDELIEIRRDLHRHPEVSGKEARTASIVADRLEAIGLDVRRGIGGHGVVALLRGGKRGPVVAFRADMDAVYSNAPDPVPFASETPGVRHICGHDVHTVVGLALAEGLTALRTELTGSVLFLFQPAEEIASGANAMIADGALDEPRPDAIFAFHTSPFETGHIATARSVMMPSRDRVSVTVTGDGSLDALARDIERVLEAVTTVGSPGERQPMGSDFILSQARVQVAEGGLERRVTGFVTTATAGARAQARQKVVRALQQLDREHDDVELAIEYEKRAIAGVMNDPNLAELSVGSASRVLGEESVTWLDGLVPAFSEDFGSFQDEVPGVMFFLGVSNSEKGWVGMPHTADYVADEEAIFVGARVMGAVILDYFMRETAP